MPDGLRFTIETVTAEGDRVIVELREYFCTKLADEVLWPLAASMQGQRRR